MADDSSRLGLPYIAAAQAQKHVTHNEAVRRLDALVHLKLASVSTTEPPAAPEAGDCWFVPEGAGGAWTGRAGSIASFADGTWDFLTVGVGFTAFVADLDRMRRFDGVRWVPFAASPSGGATELAIWEEDVALSGTSVASITLIPDRALVLAVSTRVVEAVTGATGFDCGWSGEPEKFGAALNPAEGTANVGVIGPTAVYAPTPVLLSANGGAFTGGVVRIAAHLLQCTPPAV